MLLTSRNKRDEIDDRALQILTWALNSPIPQLLMLTCCNDVFPVIRDAISLTASLDILLFETLTYFKLDSVFKPFIIFEICESESSV